MTGDAPANVPELLSRTAARTPERTAILFREQPISYADVEFRVTRTAAALAGLGLGKGDRVALMLGNIPEFVYAFYGALRAGAVVSPLNVMLTPEEVGYILADAGTKAVVCEMGTLPTVLAVRDRLPHLEHVLVVGGPPAPRGTESFEGVLERAGDAPQVQTGPGDLAVIAYTSGTTASPKGAMLTHGNLLANLEQMESVPALAEAEDDVILLVLPLFHIYALNVILGLTVKVGATAILVERFDPAETLELVQRHRCTVLFGAPPMFVAWNAMAAGERHNLSRVRLAVSGAARLPGEVLEGFRERFGVTIWEGYGLTETAPAVSSNALGSEARPNSIGLPLPGIDVRLVDEHDEDVEEDDTGEILVRGPNLFQGYWNRPEDTEAVLRDGWFHTGDIAYRDEDGYLFIVDRKKDLIIVSGFNVFPKEVEDALVTHPAVDEAAVVGIPDEQTGEAIKAMVVLEPGASLTQERLVDHLRDTLARFKLPKVIEFVEELPKLPTGKVLRRALRGEELLGGGEPAEPEPVA
ncbi:MAG: long-chain fatty acid--CoA ligase [Actinobacteria bacterium]|nr:long-chain fatty acid--CoA ligase [Actinomycetota bacterium]